MYTPLLVRTWTLAVWLAGALFFGVSEARAQARDSFGGTLLATAGFLSFEREPLVPGLGQRRPDPLRDAEVVLDGRGWLVGGGIRDVLQLDRVRFGIGAFVYTVQGVKARVGTPTGGLEATARTPWGGTAELLVGRQLRVGWLYPFADLRASLQLLSSSVELRSRTAGLLGRTSYEAYLFDVGPRVGVWLPFGGVGHVELSTRAGLFGPERFGVDLGVGIALPLSPLRGRR